MSRNESNSRGFTLVEMMVTIAILGILAAIALPAFDSFIVSTRLRTYSNDLAAAARLARSEALKRNAPVRLCMSADGATCSGSGWGQGWAVVTATNEVVRAWPATSSGYSITSTASLLTYQGNGLGDSMNAQLCGQSASGAQGRAVTVSTLGRTKVSKVSVSSC